ncbi:HoxN/HupN/NixA family nickel/cobalt transporter [Nocardia sp. NPDC059240]|uniref:HoxN/HupN/NixA family nickel/cobalt transporter n=1 Tax=Nocardia sp. NPDC059240 TaxID=3346786 RepID=UPI003679DC3E
MSATVHDPRLGSPPAPARGRFAHIAALTAAIVGLHVLGWVTLIGFVAPQHLAVGDRAFGIGLGLTAYTLGLRHAFDADHITAIDNTTRKLMNDGQRPLSVGFFFSLGHSTVVFGLALALSSGVRAIAGPVQNDSSALHRYAGPIGAAVSGGFLYLLAAINVTVLVGLLRARRRRRTDGTPAIDDATLEHHLARRGLLNRILAPVLKSITRPWQMYPVGLLFGLGFDTATEVALLILAGAGGAAGLPWYAILCLPVLFAAGMTLLDTLDGAVMTYAYGWAFTEPNRRITYNLTVTALSVVVALLVGTLELFSQLAGPLGWTGPGWNWLTHPDFTRLGLFIAATLLATWVTALFVSARVRSGRSATRRRKVLVPTRRL